MNKNVNHKIVSTLFSCSLLVLVVLAGCGGDNSGPPPCDGTGGFTTNKNPVSLCGRTSSVITPGIYPLCTRPESPSLTWTNQSIGQSGTAAVTGINEEHLFFTCKYWFSWQATIPLVEGVNDITVEGFGSKRTTVTYDPNYIPGTDTTTGTVTDAHIVKMVQWGTENRVDGANAVAVDSSDNVYITGYTGGDLEGNVSAGVTDVFVVKNDVNGNRLWTRQFGTKYDDAGQAIAIDSQGSIYLSGVTCGSFTSEQDACSNIFIAKFNSEDGGVIWIGQTRIYGHPYVVVKGLALDNSGNIFLAGSTYGSIEGTSNLGSEDVFIIKYDQVGNKMWAHHIGTSFADGGGSIAIDSNGSIYIAGRTRGDLVNDAGERYLPDAFIAKYDTGGHQVWIHQIGWPAASSSANGLAIDDADSLYVSGSTVNGSRSEVFTIKYDKDGNMLWSTRSGPAWGGANTVDSGGNVYITGYTWGSIDGQPAMDLQQIIIMKYDAHGNRDWVYQYREASYGHSEGKGVAVNSLGHVYAVGSGKLNGYGLDDAILLQYTQEGKT